MAPRKSFLLRIDAKLHDELRRWAAADLRSLNAQVEFLLRRALSEHLGREPDTDSGGPRAGSSSSSGEGLDSPGSKDPPAGSDGDPA